MKYAPRLSASLLLIILTALCLVASTGCGSGESRLSSTLDDAGTGGDNNGANNGQPDGGPTAPDAGDIGTDEDTGGDTGPTDPCLQTTPQQAADFADDYANALCSRIFSCSDNPKIAEFVTFGGWTGVDSCVAAVRAGSISAGQARQAATDGTLTLNSCEATACLDQLPNLDCVGVHRALTETRYDQMTACYDAWQGTIGSGQTCTVDAQCEGEQVCARDDAANSCTGTCADAGQSGSGQCGDIVCGADQYCQPDNNICITRNGPGEACEEDHECLPHTYCNAGECTAKSTGRTDGQSCDGYTEICGLDYGCLDGTCTSFLGEGDDCELFGCEAGLYCNQSGKCEAQRAPGASCQADQQCQSLRCAADTCTDAAILCN